jgi:multimeric flavodoxin WrbA
MKIAVIFGSQRAGGSATKIEGDIRELDLDHEFDFLRMSELRIEGCIACEKCAKTGKCALPESRNDMFNEVLRRCIESEAIFVITPLYAPYPSRLTAFMERLLSVSFFSYLENKRQRPLLGKKAAVICYSSDKIEDETQLKILFQKYFMDDYSFFEVNYDFLNKTEKPNERYVSVNEYVLDMLKGL